MHGSLSKPFQKGFYCLNIVTSCFIRVQGVIQVHYLCCLGLESVCELLVQWNANVKRHLKFKWKSIKALRTASVAMDKDHERGCSHLCKGDDVFKRTSHGHGPYSPGRCISTDILLQFIKRQSLCG